MAFIFRIFLAASCYLALFASAPAVAGDFSVNPIRLELGSQIRSGAIKIRNDGKEKLGFQIQAMAWTQDADGKDQYDDTNDLVFFPKIISVEPGEEGLVRVGAKNAILQTERTYRLFIEELPGNAKGPEGNAAQVNVLVRFGAPIFVSALKPHDALVMNGVELVKGVLSFSVKNTGNRHQVVQGIDLKGTDAKGSPVFALTMTDRYLLAGTTKSFSTKIPAGQCAQIGSLAIDMKTDKTGVSQKIDVVPAMCP